MAALLSLGTAAAHAAASGGVLVFAAASLANVLTDLNEAFTARTGIRVTSSLAASSTLAKQIEAGAPADVYFSADLQWMDYLEQRRLLRVGSRRDLVGNSLALIAPAGCGCGSGPASIRQGFSRADVAPSLVRAENVPAACVRTSARDIASSCRRW